MQAPTPAFPHIDPISHKYTNRTTHSLQAKPVSLYMQAPYYYFKTGKTVVVKKKLTFIVIVFLTIRVRCVTSVKLGCATAGNV